MKAAKVIGRVVSTIKNASISGKKILLLKPMEWEEVHTALSRGGGTAQKDAAKHGGKSIIALDAVGSGAGEYVFYVSSKEACQAFEDDAICHNAVIGIIDGIQLKE